MNSVGYRALYGDAGTEWLVLRSKGMETKRRNPSGDKGHVVGEGREIRGGESCGARQESVVEGLEDRVTEVPESGALG